MGASAIPGSLPEGRAFQHLGIVVPRLEPAAEQYARLFGISTWRCYEHGPDSLATLTYRGAPGRFRMRIAVNPGRPQIELIEPLEGPSIYEEWLAANVEGVHHVGVWVDSIDEEIAHMERQGFELTQSGFGFGVDGDGAFAYFDTAGALAVCLELIQAPRERGEPTLVLAY